MLRKNPALLVSASNASQLGPHGHGGTYNTFWGRFSTANYDDEKPKAEMKPGGVYAPGSFAGSVKDVSGDEKVPLSSNLNGVISRMIPYDLLDLRLVFDKCEPGNIKPKCYTEQVVEPISYDPEKHPVPTLFWWHKNMPLERPLSYATKPEEIETEGLDHNVWQEYRNPGAYTNERLTRRKGHLRFWGGSKMYRKKGARHAGNRKPLGYASGHKLRKFVGENPYWVQSMLSNRRVHGADCWIRGISPHSSYWKYIPMLGYTGWGTKEGHVVVEDLYTEVGLDQIQWWVDTGMLNTNEVITPNTLVESRLVGDYHWPGVKIIYNKCKWFTAKIDVDVENIDQEAIKAIEANGGSVTTRWRDQEGIAKEKTPWRFPVIGQGDLPPEELIRDLYANDKKRGYLAPGLPEKLRAHPANPREWSYLDKPISEIAEIPPVKEVQRAEPEPRSPVETSLHKKQEYWEDFLANTANTAEGRMGLLTPDKFGIWEYTYYRKQGPGHMGKREPPAGEEVSLFPGYPLRDSRYYKFVSGDRFEGIKKTDEANRKPESVYRVQNIFRRTMHKETAWEKKGEGWRTEEDKEVRYRNPYNNPLLKRRIEAWQKMQAKKREKEKKK